MTAEDADGGEFGTVRYDFSDAFNTEYTRKLFHINAVTGEICVSHDIDRDAGLVNFDLLVKAEDQVSMFYTFTWGQTLLLLFFKWPW